MKLRIFSDTEQVCVVFPFTLYLS